MRKGRTEPQISNWYEHLYKLLVAWAPASLALVGLSQFFNSVKLQTTSPGGDSVISKFFDLLEVTYLPSLSWWQKFEIKRQENNLFFTN